MAFQFENLEAWNLAVEYLDDVNRVAESFPKEEVYNRRSQWIRAATSIALNAAEGSTGQTDSEQVKFLGYAIRSLVESAACFRIAHRRKYISDDKGLMEIQMLTLIKKLQSFRNSIRGKANAPRV